MKNERKKIEWKEIGKEKIILLALCGIFLLVVSIPFPKINKKKQQENKSEVQTEKKDEEDYKTSMEKQLEDALAMVEGVGKTKVIISLEGSSEKVVNKDYTKESIKSGENQDTDSQKESEETVLSGEDQPYILRENAPKVLGVAAIIEGGDRIQVTQEVVQTLMILCHVQENQVKVLKMEENQ